MFSRGTTLARFSNILLFTYQKKKKFSMPLVINIFQCALIILLPIVFVWFSNHFLLFYFLLSLSVLRPSLIELKIQYRGQCCKLSVLKVIICYQANIRKISYRFCSVRFNTIGLDFGHFQQ